MQKALNLTRKQRQIMLLILAGNVSEDGVTVEWLDIDQLLSRLSYETSKESIQFSIRALVKKGLVEKGEPELRRSRVRRILKPTNLAFDRLTTVKSPPKEYETAGFIEYS